MAGAGLMLAHQVAGKAVRDSFFLSNYPASDLPKMVIGAAAVSLLFVLLFSRVMTRVGPRWAVPAGFFLSSVGHFAEYSYSGTAPAAWSIVIYFHIVALGAILLSGFWSLMAETFDPRAAKQIFARITGAGTLGGIAGGILAERVAALFSPLDVLVLLTLLHLSCAVIAAFLRPASPVSSPPGPSEQVSPTQLFGRAPYLWLIAAVVLGGTASAAVLDYLFKAGAGATFGKGAPLLRFFAIFYTSTQVLTFLAQTFLASRSLQRWGIGRTVAALPCGVVAGTLGALLVPVFPVFTLLRSFELVLRGSLFRSGYELLYTPIPEAEKRTAKTLLDVACDRAGDAVGGGIVALFLWLSVSFFTSALLGIALGLAGIAIWAALRLDRAYTSLIQQRLVDRAIQLDLADIQDSTTLNVIASVGAPLVARPAAQTPVRPPLPALLPKRADAVLDTFRELRCGDPSRILAALKGVDRPSPPIAAQLLRLLAWDDVSAPVREVLMRDPKHRAGLLTDYLTNEAEVEFGIRRRIPAILAHCDSQLAVHGLLAGLHDTRFEVRFQCSRALDELHQRFPKLKVPADQVFAAVERELHVARPIWESHRLIDRRDSSDPYAFLDEQLKERADQSLEHIFSLFAAVLPREPVKIAFRALHTDDPTLRGLAMEYLEGVLPPQVREHLGPVIEPRPITTPLRPPEDVLSDLLRSRESIQFRIDKPAPDR